MAGEFRCFREGLVHSRERAARVTRYQACGVTTGPGVAHILFDEQTWHGLQPGQDDGPCA